MTGTDAVKRLGAIERRLARIEKALTAKPVAPPPPSAPVLTTRRNRQPRHFRDRAVVDAVINLFGTTTIEGARGELLARFEAHRVPSRSAIGRQWRKIFEAKEAGSWPRNMPT